ncbi:MAG: family 20 glycosylhydrolase [Chitinophagaceae bacterium]
MKKILAIFITLATLQSLSQSTADRYLITPKPQQLTPEAGSFCLSAATVLVMDDPGEKPAAEFLNDYLKRLYGFTLKLAPKATKNYIRLGVKRLLVPGVEGKYDMQVTPAMVNISGDTYQGTFYGVQTILQLLPAEKAAKILIPCSEIMDQPRFKYRGLHLDVSRHFFPLDFIKKYIDYIAWFKLNTFHWHLTDDQGWRIEIKKYPNLTRVGGWRDGTIVGRYPGTGNDNIHYGGFYTQEQVKEVVQYAKDRFVTVIPEIEMPGHASAAIAAYPQLSCFPEETTMMPGPASEASKIKKGKKVQETWGVFEDVFALTDYTFNFLQDVIDEILPLFPGQYIHIGGDECPKEAWKRSPFCQQLIKEKSLKDEHGLQSYFIQRMEQYINSKGKKIIGWDEILEGGLAPNATVMSWRGEEGGIAAAQQGHEVMMTPGSFCYLDHSQSKNEDSVTIGGYLPIETVYSYDPVPASLPVGDTKYILGAQGNVWTEYIGSPSKVEYMLFPRLAALSEVLWTDKSNKSWEDFETRLPAVLGKIDFEKVNYSTAYFNIKAEIKPNKNNVGVTWNLSSKRANSTFNVVANHRLKYDGGFSVQIPDVERDAKGKKGMWLDTFIASAVTKNVPKSYSNPAVINHSGIYIAQEIFRGVRTKNYISQFFFINKATGKKISLAKEASKNYPGDGAFTLVNGVQNEKGMGKSAEFLGFNGKDCEATIDLGTNNTINKVIVHCLHQPDSWIYLPKSIEVATSNDGSNFSPQPVFEVTSGKVGNNSFSIALPATTCRYIKVKINNYGKIGDGNPGAGDPAWLFVDEVEVW